MSNLVLRLESAVCSPLRFYSPRYLEFALWARICTFARAVAQGATPELKANLASPLAIAKYLEATVNETEFSDPEATYFSRTIGAAAAQGRVERAPRAVAAPPAGTAAVSGDAPQRPPRGICVWHLLHHFKAVDARTGSEYICRPTRSGGCPYRHGVPSDFTQDEVRQATARVPEAPKKQLLAHISKFKSA
jgi:hypothetical protein